MAKQVGLVGAKVWTSRLGAALTKNSSVVCSPVSEITWKDIWKLWGIFNVDVVVRIGFRPGQIRIRCIVVDLVCLLCLLFRIPVVFYWTGSDVPRTVKMLQSPSGLAKYWSTKVASLLLKKSRHCAAAPWLVDELKSVGCAAEYFAFPAPTDAFEILGRNKPAWPKTFTVLTYVPDHNVHNYCGAEIIELAETLPEIEFRIMGGLGEWCATCPDNVTFIGWADPLKEYMNCVVLLRAVRHDALGGTVREALLCGRYALYTYPHHASTLLPSPDEGEAFKEATAAKLCSLRQDYELGVLTFNDYGRQWALENLGERPLSEKFTKYLSVKPF